MPRACWRPPPSTRGAPFSGVLWVNIWAPFLLRTRVNTPFTGNVFYSKERTESFTSPYDFPGKGKDRMIFSAHILNEGNWFSFFPPWSSRQSSHQGIGSSYYFLGTSTLQERSTEVAVHTDKPAGSLLSERKLRNHTWSACVRACVRVLGIFPVWWHWTYFFGHVLWLFSTRLERGLQGRVQCRLWIQKA